jgi:hypothetical protein
MDQITDEGIIDLKSLTTLLINGESPNISNRGIKKLTNITDLTYDQWDDDKITSDGLLKLKKLTYLQYMRGLEKDQFPRIVINTCLMKYRSNLLFPLKFSTSKHRLI